MKQPTHHTRQSCVTILAQELQSLKLSSNYNPYNPPGISPIARCHSYNPYNPMWLLRLLCLQILCGVPFAVGPINDDCESDEVEESAHDDYCAATTRSVTFHGEGGYWTHWREWVVRRRTLRHLNQNMEFIAPTRFHWWWRVCSCPTCDPLGINLEGLEYQDLDSL